MNTGCVVTRREDNEGFGPSSPRSVNCAVSTTITTTPIRMSSHTYGNKIGVGYLFMHTFSLAIRSHLSLPRVFRAYHHPSCIEQWASLRLVSREGSVGPILPKARRRTSNNRRREGTVGAYCPASQTSSRARTAHRVGRRRNR